MGSDEVKNADVTLDEVYIDLDTTVPAAPPDTEEDDRKQYSVERNKAPGQYISVLEATCNTPPANPFGRSWFRQNHLRSQTSLLAGRSYLGPS